MFSSINSSFFSWGEGEMNKGDDFLIFSSKQVLESSYDFLIFTDSKGMSLARNEIQSTWTYMLAAEKVKSGYSVLLITRPKVITVFFTLINFIRNNQIKFSFLITNLGFVDQTPKKKDFLQDIAIQLPKYFPAKKLQIQELENYELSSGQTELLCSYDYSDIADLIGEELAKTFKLSVLLGVIEFDRSIKINRARPDCFYRQLKVANEFIFKISMRANNILFFQYLRTPLIQPEKVSYDAVHFTLFGHIQLFRNIKALLKYYKI